MTRKFVMGWLRFRPGRRDAFIAALRIYVETCRAEAGCEFFEARLENVLSDAVPPDAVTFA